MIKFGRVLTSKGFNLPALAIANYNLANHNTMLMGAAFKTTNPGVAMRLFSKQSSPSSETDDGAQEERRRPRVTSQDGDDRRERRGSRLESNKPDRHDNKYTTNSQEYTKNSREIQVLSVDQLRGTEVETHLADLRPQIQEKLKQQGVKELFEVQKFAYKIFMEGFELIVKSKTGSGKTLAFLLPLEEMILRDSEQNENDKDIKAIILEPTRELAIQVQTQVHKYSALRSEVVYGGDVSAGVQMGNIRRNKPQVLVATPGRLLDLIENYGLDISRTKFKILDEGDKMLDMGFQKELTSISESMKEAKGMIFSATVPLWIQKLAVEQFSNPVLLDLIGTETNQLPDKIKHRFVICDNDHQRMDLIFEFVHQNPQMKTIVFTETKLEADSLTSREKGNFKALHGDLDQKLRKHAIDMFRKPGSSVVLVATDIAARGLDIDDVDAVIQMGCRNVDSFVHRSGRTGRAGKEGMNFVIAKREHLRTLGKYAQDLNIKYEIASTLTNQKHTVQELNLNWIEERAKRIYKSTPFDKEIDKLVEEFDLLPMEKQDKLLRLMLNERVPVFNQDQGFNMRKDSLLSGRANMKTYFITQKNKEIAEVLEKNKIYYLYKNHNDENQILFELFDERKELLEEINSVGTVKAEPIDILPPQFIGPFLRQVESRESSRSQRTSFLGRDDQDGESRQRSYNRDRGDRGYNRGERDYQQRGDRDYQQRGDRYDNRRSDRSDRGYQRRSSFQDRSERD